MWIYLTPAFISFGPQSIGYIHRSVQDAKEQAFVFAPNVYPRLRFFAARIVFPVEIRFQVKPGCAPIVSPQKSFVQTWLHGRSLKDRFARVFTAWNIIKTSGWVTFSVHSWSQLLRIVSGIPIWWFLFRSANLDGKPGDTTSRNYFHDR